MADPYWNNVVLAMSFDGPDGSTTFTDISPAAHVFGVFGDAHIETDQYKFGGSSGYFDTSGDYISTPDSNDWDVSGAYTIEFWFYPQRLGTGGYGEGMVCNAAQAGSNGFFIGLQNSRLAIRVGTTSFGAMGWPALDTWSHLAIVWGSGTTRVYLNGISLVSVGPNTFTSPNPLVIGNTYPPEDVRKFSGYIDDLRITKGVERYTANFTPPAASYFGPDRYPVQNALVGEYATLFPVLLGCVGMYSLVMEQALVGRYGDATLINASLIGRYGDASQVQTSLIGRYGNTLPVLAVLEGRYHLMHSVLSGLEGKYAICGSEVLAGLEGRYDLRERNEIAAALVGYYSLLPDATLQSITCPVLIGGVAVKWSSVQWTINESSYLIEATISLRDGAEFGSIGKNDQVTITWQGTVYTLFVASKLRSRSVSGSLGAADYGVDYTIAARSLTAGLDEPYALPVTLSWPAATMQSAIAAQLIAPLSDIISLDWRLEDQLQPGGTFFLTDETPLVGLRKLAGIVGGILQTSPDNALIVRKADPVAPKDWPTTTPAWTIEDSGLFSDSESEDISSLYNVVTVTNQSATDSSIRFETEEIDRYRHRVKGYRVPWADFTLATSGGAWVTIENMGIVAEQIVETVEFIDGASSTTNPVYSTVSAVWLRTQLGAITAAEDGSLTSEVTGCSLAEVTYTTRYHAWIGRSDRDEEVQFYAVELP